MFFFRERCCHEQLETLRLMFAPSLFSPIHLLQVINTHMRNTLHSGTYATLKCMNVILLKRNVSIAKVKNTLLKQNFYKMYYTHVNILIALAPVS